MNSIIDNQTKNLSLSYPFDWTGLDSFEYPLDKNGVPQVYMGKKLSLQYNPITAAQFGLFHLQKFAEREDENSYQHAQNAVNWLVDNFQIWQNNIGAWVYNYDLDFYGPKAPWISAMAQAQGISFLLRAYQKQSDDRYLEMTQQAFRAFLFPVTEGGVRSSFPDNSPAFEEFPTEPPSLVLNGHIFTLLGIYDFAYFYQDNKARQLFEVSVEGLKRNLHRYDTGFWNLYDLHPTGRLASPMYLKVHVQLLRILFKITNEQLFNETANRWQRYLTSPICRSKWLIRKMIEKIKFGF